jgi:hypothetical protein
MMAFVVRMVWLVTVFPLKHGCIALDDQWRPAALA